MATNEGLRIRAIPVGTGLLQSDEFFDLYASQPASIHDLPFTANPALAPGGYHGSVIHIVQDLAVNRSATGTTSYAFREMLGKADRMVKVTLDGQEQTLKVGNYAWRTTYDLLLPGHMPTPEMSGSLLKVFLNAP